MSNSLKIKLNSYKRLLEKENNTFKIEIDCEWKKDPKITTYKISNVLPKINNGFRGVQ